jgi:hypothetical protein
MKGREYRVFLGLNDIAIVIEMVIRRNILVIAFRGSFIAVRGRFLEVLLIPSRDWRQQSDHTRRLWHKFPYLDSYLGWEMTKEWKFGDGLHERSLEMMYVCLGRQIWGICGWFDLFWVKLKQSFDLECCSIPNFRTRL